MWIEIDVCLMVIQMSTECGGTIFWAFLFFLKYKHVGCVVSRFKIFLTAQILKLIIHCSTSALLAFLVPWLFHFPLILAFHTQQFHIGVEYCLEWFFLCKCFLLSLSCWKLKHGSSPIAFCSNHSGHGLWELGAHFLGSIIIQSFNYLLKILYLKKII